MSTKISPDPATCEFAKRFITAYFSLRSHITSQSVINYPPVLSPNQLKMLHLVFHRPGISQTAVAERLGVTTASISTSVREMEAQGLVERRANPDDARVMLLHLAPLGEQIFEQVFDSFINTCADLLGAVSPNDQQQLVERFEAVLVANNIVLDDGRLSYTDRLRVMKDSPNPVS
jgi:DNA-binding MarR family transcriptional regulator